MAVAFDTKASGSGDPVSSITFSHTCTGSNLILHVAAEIEGDASDHFNTPGATYAGTNMTRLDLQQHDNNTARNWYLLNPSTGANNVVVSIGVSKGLSGMSASYTGAQQNGQPDAHTSQGNSNVGSQAVNITTVADNCLVSGISMDGNNPTVTAGANTTSRGSVSNTDGRTDTVIESSAAIHPAGLTTLNMTYSVNNGYPSTFLMSIVPSAATVVNNSSNLSLLGAGI